MVLSEIVASLSNINPRDLVRPADPGRIAAQVVTGIGFLGAGVIIKEGVNIRGLTTAACLWITAGIGMAAGAGYYFVAVVTTIVALFSLIVLKYSEKLYLKDSYRILTVVTTNDVDASNVIDTAKRKKLNIINCNVERNYDTQTTTTRLSIRLFHRGITDKLSHGILKAFEDSEIPLKAIKWDHT